MIIALLYYWSTFYLVERPRPSLFLILVPLKRILKRVRGTRPRGSNATHELREGAGSLQVSLASPFGGAT